MEVYINDILVNLPKSVSLVGLKKYNMKLNPNKYAFKVVFGRFLGFIVTSKGLKPTPKKL